MLNRAQSKRSVNVSEDSNADLWAHRCLDGESHAASPPWLQSPAPLSTGSAPPKFQRYHQPSSSAVWVGTWQCCTSPCHPRAQLFLGGSVSMARTLMRHAGLTICHLSVYLCVYLSSIYFCIYHLFIYLSSINSVSVCVSSIYLHIYHLPIIPISVFIIYLYINYLSTYVSITYWLCIYYHVYHLSTFVSIYLCVYHL